MGNLTEEERATRRPFSTITGSLTREELRVDSITEEQFDAYVKVQMSGVTNMWAVNLVCELSNLEKDQVMTIMKNYKELKAKFKGAE